MTHGLDSNQIRQAAAALAVALTLLLETISASAQNLELRAKIEVDSKGVFLNQILAQDLDESYANILVMPAPAWGKIATLDQRAMGKLVATVAPQLGSATWSGAAQVQISRESQKLDAPSLISLLEAKLRPANTGTSTELRLAFQREWKPVSIPTGAIDLRLIKRPATGLQPFFEVSFEAFGGKEPTGVVYSAFLEAHLYREVWVARTPLKRFTSLEQADLIREARDIISLKEQIWEGESLDPSFRITQPVAGSSILLARAVAQRPVILRNQSINAVAKQGVLSVFSRVIAMEDGAVGQEIQARNEFRKLIKGKVIDENTIQVEL